MLNAGAQPHGVMEGKGSYNKHAKLPAGGAALAMPLLEKAVQNVELDTTDQPIVIADYGSSQGKNSMIPMQVAIRGLRRRVGPNRAISVFHIDQPSNDFNSLFGVLDADSDRYVLDESHVFPAAIGRSFYENVLPPDSVHLGWSSYAAVWLSRIPALIPGHFFYLFSTGSVRAEFERQSAQDWAAFLSLRSRELHPGGRLVVVLPALADDGSAGFEPIFEQANAVLAEMASDGAITSEERSRMVIGAFPRRKRDLLAPFAANGKFQQLTVEDCEMYELPDAAWADYERDRDKEALVTKHVLFFRSIFVPSLASALVRVREGDAEAFATFSDQVEQRLKRRLTSQLAPMHSFVQTIVLAKSKQD
ncbi:MAG TPA: hypothetical protein VIX91_19240 [Candidatus Acidoferrum sp.]